jgi:MFS family permease
MKEEELIKQLENTKRPDIKLESHQIQLKMALLSHGYSKKRKGGSFLETAAAKTAAAMDTIIAGFMARRLGWRVALTTIVGVVVLFVALISIPQISAILKSRFFPEASKTNSLSQLTSVEQKKATDNLTAASRTGGLPFPYVQLTVTMANKTSVNLSWENSGNVTGFTLQRITSGIVNSGWVAFPSLGQNVTSYLDTSIYAGTTYFYRIFALNSSGSSLVSNTAWVAVPPQTTGPIMLGAKMVNATSVNLTWADGSNVTGFTLQRATSGNFSSGLVTFPPISSKANSYLDTSINAGTVYYYRFLALNSLGSSPVSNTATALPAPTDVELKQAFDAIANIQVIYDSGKGIDNTAGVLAAADLLYRSLYGSTIEEPQNGIGCAVHFVGEKEWLDTTNNLSMLGYTRLDNSNHMGLYIRAGGTGPNVLWMIAGHSGRSLMDREWASQTTPESFGSYWSCNYTLGQQGAADLNEIAFMRRLEEAGVDLPKYAFIDRNVVSVAKQLTLKFDSGKTWLWNSTGELSNMGAGGAMVKYFMIAIDPDFTDAKTDLTTNGRVSSADYVRLINKLIQTSPTDLPTYFKGIFDSSKFDAVSKWYVTVFTGPTRLNGQEVYPSPSTMLLGDFGRLVLYP